MPVIKQALTVAVAAAGLVGAAAGTAAATTVIGAGNSAHDNHCANKGAARTQARANTAGDLVGEVFALTLSAPANQCGDLGLPKEDKADQPTENAHVDMAE
ncbi:hypothetical protein [Streptomyces monomycini]|uniref:hypothetical protein n=1 Tax=Streptomyces monomycini TaxID=371720 RepID=UPI00067C885A|nr:hypothetical protein [Streptomyces monomycini]